MLLPCQPWSIIRTLLFLLLLHLVQGSSQARGPVSYYSLLHDVEIHSPSHRVNAYSSFSITFSLHRRRQQVKLQLEPNHDIIDDTTIEYLDANGKTIRTEPIQRHTIKVFKGTAWVGMDGDWAHAGWARVLIHKDGLHPLFDGAFALFGDNHHIQLKSNYMRTKHELDPQIDGPEEFMVVTRDSDATALVAQVKRTLEDDQQAVMCSHDKLSFNTHPEHAIHRLFSGNLSVHDDEPPAGIFGSLFRDGQFTNPLTKRQLDTGSYGGGGFSSGVNLRDTIGQTTGCPTSRKVALFGVIADCTYVATFDGDQSKTRANIISQVNSASDLYERSFNISLGLSNLIVTNETCPVSPPPDTQPWNNACSSNITIEDRLSILSQWRGGRSADGLAFWTQLTNCPTGTSVGLAWLGMLCHPEAQQQQNQFVSSANVVARTSTEWKVIAHEIGHTFGAVHDCTSDICANTAAVSSSQCCPLSAGTCDAQQQYIMNPSTNEQIAAFSPCTIGNICSALGRNSVNSTCLSTNKNVKTVTENVCGNGIVEVGEECDCGDDEACADNRCCDPKTCKFINGAVCDDSNEDCCSGCQFASSETVCRASTGSCDPEEKCPGNAAACPTDVVAPNGQSCGDNLQCASGQCTSRDAQCRTIMGQLASTGNSTVACDDQEDSCQLFCQSDDLGPQCYSVRQWFVDGTSCGGGGRCKQGICVGGSVFNDVKSWIDRHLPLVIGLSAGIGGLLLITVACCCFRACSRRRRLKKAPTPPINYPPPPSMTYAHYANNSNNRRPPMPANPSSHGYPVPAPYSPTGFPPSYGGYSRQESNMPWPSAPAPVYMEDQPPSRSVRYA